MPNRDLSLGAVQPRALSRSHWRTGSRLRPEALTSRPQKLEGDVAREIQLGFAAAQLALEDASPGRDAVDAVRFGVVFAADMMYSEGAEIDAAFLSCMVDGKFDFSRWGEAGMREMFPLWMLKYLPNMPACHVAIAHDARGPNNSILMAEASSLLALSEGMRTIEMDRADLMIVGGTSCPIHARNWVFRDPNQFSRRYAEPSRAVRPFDADRDGEVLGEGAAAFVLESRSHAAARGARPLARLISYASTFGCPCSGRRWRGHPQRRSAWLSTERRHRRQ